MVSDKEWNNGDKTFLSLMSSKTHATKSLEIKRETLVDQKFADRSQNQLVQVSKSDASSAITSLFGMPPSASRAVLNGSGCGALRLYDQ